MVILRKRTRWPQAKYLGHKQGMQAEDILTNAEQIKEPGQIKLKYFTNLDFPEIRGIPLLNHHFGETGRVRSL